MSIVGAGMETEPILDAVRLAGLLADRDRRLVVAALLLGARTVEEVQRSTALSTRALVTALGRLVASELVVRNDDGDHFVVEEAFRAAAIAAAPEPGGHEPDLVDQTTRVLRSFLRDNRLSSIPAAHGKRLIILDHLAQAFEPGRRYRERDVNAILARWHEDTAALRRYLVDDGFLDREGGEYWRSGGSVSA